MTQYLAHSVNARNYSRHDERDLPLHFSYGTKAGDNAACEALGIKARRKERRAAAVGIATALVRAPDDSWISYSRNRQHPGYTDPQRYRRPGFAYRPIRSAVDDLHAAGLIEEERAAADGPSGWQSRLKPTQKLRLILPGEECIQLPPYELVELRAAKDAGQETAKERRRDYRDTEATRRTRREIIEINEAIGSVKIYARGERIECAHLRRIYNEKFTQGGRFYAQGNSWQNCGADERATVTIDREATVEADFKSINIRLLYEERGIEADGDPYTITGYDRADAKRAMLILLNATNGKHSAICAVAHKLQERHEGLERSEAMRRARNLVEKLEERHSRIAGEFYSGCGLRLMNVESNIAAMVQREANCSGRVFLPIHDGFLAKASDENALYEAMTKASQTIVGKSLPFLTINN